MTAEDMSVHKKALPGVVTREDIKQLDQLVYNLNQRRIVLMHLRPDGQGYPGALDQCELAQQQVDAAFKAIYKKLDQQ